MLASFDERVVHYELAIGSDDLEVRMTSEYDINLDDKYGQLVAIDIAAEAAAHEPWFNQTLTSVNDAVVRLGVIEGDFHWHKHDAEDEFFLVLEGELVIEVEGSDAVRLRPHQGFTVPRDVSHKTSAPNRTVCASRSQGPSGAPTTATARVAASIRERSARRKAACRARGSASCTVKS